MMVGLQGFEPRIFGLKGWNLYHFVSGFDDNLGQSGKVFILIIQMYGAIV